MFACFGLFKNDKKSHDTAILPVMAQHQIKAPVNALSKQTNHNRIIFTSISVIRSCIYALCSVIVLMCTVCYCYHNYHLCHVILHVLCWRNIYSRKTGERGGQGKLINQDRFEMCR